MVVCPRSTSKSHLLLSCTSSALLSGCEWDLCKHLFWQNWLAPPSTQLYSPLWRQWVQAVAQQRGLTPSRKNPATISAAQHEGLAISETSEKSVHFKEAPNVQQHFSKRPRWMRRCSWRSPRSDLCSSLHLKHPQPDPTRRAGRGLWSTSGMTGDLAPCHDVPSPDLPYNTDANLLVKKLHQRACLRVATAWRIRRAAVTCRGNSELKWEESGECGCEQIPLHMSHDRFEFWTEVKSFYWIDRVNEGFTEVSKHDCVLLSRFT